MEIDYEKLQEIIRNELKPLVEKVNKHELCLYGEDGTNGIQSWINSLKGHLRWHYVWTTIVVLPSVAGIILLFAGFFGKKAGGG